MREIVLAQLDKTRPVLVLTREAARAAMTKVTVAPITTTIKGLSSEVVLGPQNGLDYRCAVLLLRFCRLRCLRDFIRKFRKFCDDVAGLAQETDECGQLNRIPGF